ncbi:MAG: hypothetical protein R2729_27530 [Bryobacteraceae bacterium]
MRATAVGLHPAVLRLATAVSNRRAAHRIFEQIRDGIYLDRPRQQANQLEAVRAVAGYAIRNCSAYARLFEEAGLPPERIASSGDLRRIAPVTKRAVRDRMHEFVSRVADADRCVLKSTSGSAGEPLIFPRDPEYVLAGRAGTMRNMALAGWEPGDAVGHFWGFDRDVESFGKRMSGLLSRNFYFNAFRQNEAAMARWARRIRMLRIRFLYGYPNSLEVFARFLAARGEALNIRAVFCTAEQYLPHQRQAVESAFGCKSYNLYGSAEIQNIAFECRAGSMHVAADFVVAQEEDFHSEAPSLVLTSLLSRCLPFIRYELGDHGRLRDEPCPCGIPGETMELLGGKRYDFLRSRNGVVHGAIVARAFCRVGGIHRYRMIQHDFERFTACAVLPADDRRQDLRRELEGSISDTIRAHFGSAATVDFEYPEAIPPAASGKFRFIVREFDSA